MEEKRTINVDYISIVRQEGNLVKLEHIDIRKPESLLSDLKAILEDPERTLLDLQSRMCEFYEEGKRRNISYLHHSDYTNAHTTGYVSFPKIYHQDEYNDMIREIEARTISKNCWSLSRIKERDGETAYQEKLNSYITEALQNKKDIYYRQCLTFITAITYKDASDECKKDPSIKLHSDAFCGGCSKDLRVNSDIVLRITAQLGYSSQSAYLGISLWYKGILIEPYSFFVNHFRLYQKYDWYIKIISPHTLCWEDIFQSVVDMANMATTHPEQFYNKYIKDEIKKMISGLTYIVEKPKYFIDSLIDDKDSFFDNGIRPEHVKIYKEFPDDMSMALIADKLSDAYELLSHLSDLALIESTAQSACETIEGYIKKMLPKIKEYYVKNCDAIEKLNKNISDTKERLKELKDKMAVHTRRIDERYEGQDPSKPIKCHSLIEAEYERGNYDFRYLKDRIIQTERDISSILDMKYKRNQILPSLQHYLDIIKG